MSNLVQFGIHELAEVDLTSAPKLRATGPIFVLRMLGGSGCDCLAGGSRDSWEFWRRLNILTGREYMKQIARNLTDPFAPCEQEKTEETELDLCSLRFLLFKKPS